MRFAVGPFSLVPAVGETSQEAVERIMRYVGLAEDLGFHAAWFDEVEIGGDGPYCAPAVVAAAAAARTRALRLGVCAVITRGHPLRIAEEIAVLDVLSNGRVLVCPIPVSYEEREEDVSEFEERFEILRLAWSGAPFEYAGRHLKIPALLPANTGARGYSKVAVTPAPVQTVISIWLPAWCESGRRLGSVTGAPLLAAPFTPRRELAIQYESQRRASRTLSSPAALIPLIREVCVAKTKEAAREVVGVALENLYERYARRHIVRGSRTFAALAADRFIIGNPDDCVAEIRRYEELGVNYLICRVAWPGVNPQAVEASMNLLARTVIPHFTMFGYPSQAASLA